MKITAVRVRKLMSGPGYNHHAVEAEAAVTAHEDARLVSEQLAAWVDGQLRGHREIDELHALRDRLRSEVESLRARRDDLRKDVERGYKIIAAHDKLRELAEKNGLTGVDDLGDPMPF